MKDYRQIYLVFIFSLLQSCNTLGGNNMGLGSKNNWHTYETKIGEVILQYSLPDGQSGASPRISIPKKKVNLSSSSENIFHGFWDFSSSRFKHVDGSLKCSIGVLRLKNNLKTIEDFSEYLKKESYQDWKVRNDKWLKKADYLSPLKYVSPSGFEVVQINGKDWYKYWDPHLTFSYPISENIFVSISIFKAFGSSNNKLLQDADMMADRIISSLTIINQKK